MELTSKDVINKAVEIIKSNEYDNTCGDGECLFCAISRAKTILDEQHGTGASLVECFMYPTGGLFSDFPLEMARDLIQIKLGGSDPPTSKEEAISFLLSLPAS